MSARLLFRSIALISYAILTCVGCSITDKYKVNKLESLFKSKNYRRMIEVYDSLAPTLKTNDQVARARNLYDKAYSIVSRSQAAIDSADVFAKYGYAPDAYRLYTRAIDLEPTEQTIVDKRNATPENGTPIFVWAGSMGDAEFVLTFHTKWISGDIHPASVDITVTNKSPMQPVFLVQFVPFLRYQAISNNQMHMMMVIFSPPFANEFKTPIWRGKTQTGHLSYKKAKVFNRNSDISLSEVFTRIMTGSDEACYLTLLGSEYSKISGFLLDGYDVGDTRAKVKNTTTNVSSEPGYIEIVSSKASSSLTETKTNKYYPELSYDGKVETAWQEATGTGGVGEWIEYHFEKECSISKIKIINGYGKYSNSGIDRYPQNSRIRKAALHFSDGSVQQLSMADKRDFQEISLDVVRTRSARLEIVEIYPGSKWNDNGISEIAFYGSGN